MNTAAIVYIESPSCTRSTTVPIGEYRIFWRVSDWRCHTLWWDRYFWGNTPRFCGNSAGDSSCAGVRLETDRVWACRRWSPWCHRTSGAVILFVCDFHCGYIGSSWWLVWRVECVASFAHTLSNGSDEVSWFSVLRVTAICQSCGKSLGKALCCWWNQFSSKASV